MLTLQQQQCDFQPLATASTLGRLHSEMLVKHRLCVPNGQLDKFEMHTYIQTYIKVPLYNIYVNVQKCKAALECCQLVFGMLRVAHGHCARPNYHCRGKYACVCVYACLHACVCVKLQLDWVQQLLLSARLIK